MIGLRLAINALLTDRSYVGVMKINDCRNLTTPTTLAQRAPALEVNTPSAYEPLDSFESSEGWLSAGFSCAGGLVAIAGAISNQPMLKAAGILTTAVATGFTSWRVQAYGAMDSAAAVSIVGGSALCTAGLLLGASVSPNQGAASLLIQRLGLRGL